MPGTPESRPTEASPRQQPGSQNAASAPAELELTILMPCLNEARTVGTCVRKALGFLARSGIAGEVVVADNGSTDGSQQVARDLGARVVSVPIRGYGAALRAGTAAARGRYVIMGDSDDSYDLSELGAFVEKLREGFELVVGNRFWGGVRHGAMPWKNRYIGNPLLSGLGRLLFGSQVRDFHCGLRGYPREVFQRLDLRTTGMEFASEMVIKATLYGLRICEVPTTLSPDGRDRPPHLRPWRDGWRHLRFILLFSPRWLFLYPGLALFGGGLLVMLWLLPAPRSLFGLGLDVHTLLFAAVAVLVGAQAVGFHLLSKIFTINEGLMPEDPRLTALARRFPLEVGLLLAALLVLLGIAGAVGSVAIWGKASFGSLDPAATLRPVIASATALTLGVQLFLFSFFGSVLGLKVTPKLGAEGSDLV